MTCCATTQCAVDPILHHPGYAITVRKRVPTLPNVPASAEAGVPGFDLTTWYGMYAPAQHAETDRGCARYRSAKSAQDLALINRFAELSMTPVEEERATSAALEPFSRQKLMSGTGSSRKTQRDQSCQCGDFVPTSRCKEYGGSRTSQRTIREGRRVGTAIQLFAISVLDVWV